MENQKPLTKLQKEALITKILGNCEKNSEYKKHIENRIKELNNKNSK